MRLFVLVITISVLLIEFLCAQGGKSSLYFAGGDDIVWCGNDSTLNVQDAITLEAWIKSDGANNSWARILDKFNFHARQGYNLSRRDGTGSFRLDSFTTDNVQHPSDGSTFVFDDKWHYVAATFNGTEFTIYVDGRIENRTIIDTLKKIRICPDYFAIGNGWDGATWFPYRGQIDEARVWDKAVDSLTIKDWMHKEVSTNHPDLSNLVGYWKFNEGEGSNAGDSSGVGNHGTLTKMDTTASWFQSSVPIAGSFANNLDNVSAVWSSVDSSSSSILSIKDTNIVEDACIIFGHDGADLSWSSSDIPEALDILYRTNRIWRTEVYDTVAGDIIFDVSDLNISDGSGLKLLIDSDGTFSNADTVYGKYDSLKELFIVSGQRFQHAFYYTLGAGENVVAIPQNLILNPSCEDSLINGEIPYWTEVIGSYWTQRISANPPTHEGDYMFFPGAVSFAELQQDVDLTPMATSIDSNNLTFTFEGFVRAFNQPSPDLSRIKLEYLDSLKTTKLDSFDSGNYSNTSEWIQITDTTLAPIGTRFIRIRLISTRRYGSNNDGYYDNLSLRTDFYVNIRNNKKHRPITIKLFQNYPNPFNPSTHITFTIPEHKHVTLEVYNPLGQKIETLLNKSMVAGNHQIEFKADNLPSGIYFYRIEAGEFQQVKKMVLLK